VSLWTRIGGDLVGMSTSHALARVVVVLAGAGFITTLGLTAPLQPFAVAVMLALVLLAAYHTHSVLPLVAMGYLLLSWVGLAPASWSIASLPAAWCLVLLHTGAAVCAAVPAAAPIPAALWRLYARRLAVIAVVTSFVWATAPVVQALPAPGLVPVGASLVAVLVLVAAHYRRVISDPTAPDRMQVGPRR
jgi:hypothetical protein